MILWALTAHQIPTSGVKQEIFINVRGFLKHRYLSFEWFMFLFKANHVSTAKTQVFIFLQHWICSTYFWYAVYYPFTWNNWHGIIFYKTSGNIFPMKHTLQMYCYWTCAGNTQKVTFSYAWGIRQIYLSVWWHQIWSDGHKILRKN